MSGVGILPDLSWGGEGNTGSALPCDLSHDAFDVSRPPPKREQTDACENITFPQR